MKSTIKAMGWNLLACLLPMCLTLEGHEYRYFELPNLVYPTYICAEDQLYSPCDGRSSPIRASFGHTEGNWFDVEFGYTTMSSFLAFALDHEGDFIPFFDIRGHVFNNGRWASNVGVGFRNVVGCKGDIFGANVYYDYRQSNRGQNLNQVGLGFEFLSSSLDIRLNLYFNVGQAQDKIHEHTFDNYIGPYFATCKDTRSVLSGGDLEFGSWFVPCGCFRFLNLYGSVIPYCYASSSNKDHRHENGIYGIAGRLTTLLGNYFALELRAGYDSSYKGMVQGTLTFEMPLDQLFNWSAWCESGCPDDCQIYQPVRRQEMIVLSPKRCCWESNF